MCPHHRDGENSGPAHELAKVLDERIRSWGPRIGKIILDKWPRIREFELKEVYSEITLEVLLELDRFPLAYGPFLLWTCVNRVCRRLLVQLDKERQFWRGSHFRDANGDFRNVVEVAVDPVSVKCEDEQASSPAGKLAKDILDGSRPDLLVPEKLLALKNALQYPECHCVITGAEIGKKPHAVCQMVSRIRKYLKGLFQKFFYK